MNDEIVQIIECPLNKHDQALQVLLIVRRRLLNRMASVIVRNQDSLLNGDSHTNNPLGTHADLAEIIKNLGEIDGAIDGLMALQQDNPSSPELSADSHESRLPAKDRQASTSTFSKFASLVALDKLEEASHELGNILQMSLDRMITATRFYARAVKNNLCLVDQLHLLCHRGKDWSEAECMRTLIKTFGFQAVESRMAMQALRAHQSGSTDKTLTDPAKGVTPTI